MPTSVPFHYGEATGTANMTSNNGYMPSSSSQQNVKDSGGNGPVCQDPAKLDSNESIEIKRIFDQRRSRYLPLIDLSKDCDTPSIMEIEQIGTQKQQLMLDEKKESTNTIEKGAVIKENKPIQGENNSTFTWKNFEQKLKTIGVGNMNGNQTKLHEEPVNPLSLNKKDEKNRENYVANVPSNPFLTNSQSLLTVSATSTNNNASKYMPPYGLINVNPAIIKTEQDSHSLQNSNVYKPRIGIHESVGKNIYVSSSSTSTEVNKNDANTKVSKPTNTIQNVPKTAVMPKSGFVNQTINQSNQQLKKNANSNTKITTIQNNFNQKHGLNQVPKPVVMGEGSHQLVQQIIRNNNNTTKTATTNQPPTKPTQPSKPIANSNKRPSTPPWTEFLTLKPLPNVPDLYQLNTQQVFELERMLQFRGLFNNEKLDSWKDDWGGNLLFMDKELVMNRDKIHRNPAIKADTISFREWVFSNAKDGTAESFRGVTLLFSYVYHLKDTPPMAKRILSYALCRRAQSPLERRSFIVESLRRISYDPIVLQEDGWTTTKIDKPMGNTGGAFFIGQKVIWSRFEAIVIAYVKDEDLGDLWKAMWLQDLETFDLEADELQDAIKKYTDKEARKKAKLDKNKNAPGVLKPVPPKQSLVETKVSKPSTSTRFAATTNFTVEGIEHGIILALSYHEHARFGILWPARVLHVSEFNKLNGSGLTSRRSSQKNNIPVVFLAPYWNGGSSKVKSGNFDKTANKYSAGPLFELDNIEVSPNTIQKYPFSGDSDSILIDKLRDSFRFLGLPDAAFARYVDSHRLAQSLQYYARNYLSETSSSANACAALTETHALSVKTAMFPNIVLSLPYEYIISKLPPPGYQASQLGNASMDEECEPILQIGCMVKSMIPPLCWKKATDNHDSTTDSHITHEAIGTPINALRQNTPVTSPQPRTSKSYSSNDIGDTKEDNNMQWCIADFASEYLLHFIENGGKKSTSSSTGDSSIFCLSFQLSELVKTLCADVSKARKHTSLERKEILNSLSAHCLLVKRHGEETFHSYKFDRKYNVDNLICEWRKACEKIYKCVCIELSIEGLGNGVTTVITDSRCNQHLTSSGSFERAVRIPAAIKGAKSAGAGQSKSFPLITKVKDDYLDLAENKVIPRAHQASYLKRIKRKISALLPDAKGVPLTDDSEGEGGEDTMGSRGSYTAAVTGVAAALQAVDMVVGGDCVNAFCAVRPPGHHAGKELRPMNAVSNGFCLLNGAACAAIYATMSKAEGGCGLKRICIIDFDVHHGNGTQDILCSTHDSRFLYISVHAGGAHINGYENENGSVTRSLVVGSKQPEGIFPGRCGDSSPHPGVLNIPLGQKVTAHAVGNALVSKVSPAVQQFAPELMILSAGFDAHKNDPLGMGGLAAKDFGSITEVACQMAVKCCSGRIISLLEGGYGVPCCRKRDDLFLPNSTPQNKKLEILDLGHDLPASMEDNVNNTLAQVLDKCHAEGFLHCVKEHVGALRRSNKRSSVKI